MRSNTIVIAKMGVATLFTANDAKAIGSRIMSQGNATRHQQQHQQRKRFIKQHQHLILSIFAFDLVSLPISPSQYLPFYLSIYQFVYMSISLSSFYLSISSVQILFLPRFATTARISLFTYILKWPQQLYTLLFQHKYN